MKLHEDKAAFRVLLSEINRQTGYRMDILEKDYYVTLTYCGKNSPTSEEGH